MTATMTPSAPDIGVALRRIALGYRLFGALWLDALALLALARGDASPIAAGTAMAVASSWALCTVILAGSRPTWFRSWWFLGADVAVAGWTIVGWTLVGLDPGAGSTAFFGGYPFSAAVLAAYTRGYAGGLSAGGALAAAAIARRLALDALEVQAIFQDLVFYVGGGAILAWGLTVVLRQDELLAAEREQRIRSQERADTAAHLHDSVLQTLALIQRRAGDSGEVVALARGQERELRGWLFGAGAGPATDSSLVAALQQAAAQIEAQHRLHVDLVHVGDAPLDDHLGALAAAVREALANCAKHAGVDSVSVYAEITPEQATVFVRDRGRGFDPAAVDADRAGIRESIIARLERHGGAAAVRSRPGEGTEVEMTVRLSRAG